MPIAGSGIALGVVAALGAVRGLRSLVFDVGTRDPAAFIAAVVVLALVALLASWLPARSATRVDPVRVLGRE
jgi:ABC-type antimicrobial peptide transport system permease subunit